MGQQIKDVTGEVHNMLTILSLSESRRTPRGILEKQVLVRCECGVEKIVGYKDLKRGDTKSCGCLNKSRKRDIIQNNKFGFWTILCDSTPYRDNKGNTLRRVEAQCICGTNKKVILDTLTKGDSKSCGCKGAIKKDKIQISVPESTNFEQWVEAYGFKDYYISSKGRVFSIKKNKGYLNISNKTSIKLILEGISKIFNIAEIVYKSFISEWDKKEFMLLYIDDDRLNNCLDNLFLAKISKNGVNWVSKAYNSMSINGIEKSGQRKKLRTLSKRHIIEIYKKQEGLSYYLKLPMDLTGEDILLSISVDRIDNDKDYEEGNIVLATRFENMGRRTATFEQMKDFCTHLKYEGTL
jgi:translation initiation factor 1 (eIF-1/SUI1)